MKAELPEQIKQCLKTLKDNNISAYLVGGCVRDMLMGKTPNDYDITVNTSPLEVKKLFKHTVDTGLKHGTVTVIIDKMPIEITQMRIDGEYADHRRPQSVMPAQSINEDVVRRDFTVNAIAMDDEGNLTDISNGLSDIENKIIRAVGEPKKRFSEDALRILRAFRFCSQLGFEIEEKTLESALECAPFLKNISAERIQVELIKTVCGDSPAMLSHLINSGGLAHIGIEKCDDLSIIPRLPNIAYIRLAALIIICRADCFVVCDRLKLSNKQKQNISFLCECFKQNLLFCAKTKRDMKQIVAKSDFDAVKQLISLSSVLKNEDLSNKTALLNDCKNEPIFIKDLAVNGNDLILLGICGLNVGTALKELQQHIWENPNDNSKEKLIDVAKLLKL